MIIVVILIFAAIGLIELLPLYKNKKAMEFKVYSFIFLLGFILFTLQSFDISIPSPAKVIEVVIELALGR